VPLKELVLRLNRTLWGQFLREICPRKKCTPKSGAVNGIITGILLIQRLFSKQQQQQDEHPEGLMGSFKCLKAGAKAGGIVTQESVRYFLILHNKVDDTWQAYRLNGIQKDGKTSCQCSSCKQRKDSLGITMHMQNCPRNDTPTRKFRKNNKEN
jgi:hypothetical protein